MKITSGHTRRDALGVVALSALLVVSLGCGSSDTSEPLASDPPVTDTETTSPETTQPPVTEPPATDPVVTEPPATDPVVTEPPATDPVVTDPPAEGGGYEPAGRGVAPSFDGKTDPIVDPLPDGLYWSWDYAPSGDTVEFTLVQFFVGDACIEQFGSVDECPSDNNTLETPTATVELDLDVATASVIRPEDTGGFKAFRVSADEFVRLVAGSGPAADAPEGYSFVPFGVVATVRDGRVVAVDQVFTS